MPQVVPRLTGTVGGLNFENLVMRWRVHCDDTHLSFASIWLIVPMLEEALPTYPLLVTLYR